MGSVERSSVPKVRLLTQPRLKAWDRASSNVARAEGPFVIRPCLPLRGANGQAVGPLERRVIQLPGLQPGLGKRPNLRSWFVGATGQINTDRILGHFRHRCSGDVQLGDQPPSVSSRFPRDKNRTRTRGGGLESLKRYIDFESGLAPKTDPSGIRRVDQVNR